MEITMLVISEIIFSRSLKKNRLNNPVLLCKGKELKHYILIQRLPREVLHYTASATRRLTAMQAVPRAGKLNDFYIKLINESVHLFMIF